MSNLTAAEWNERLRSHMQAVQISSYRALAIRAGVSRWQIQQLRSGQLFKMRLDILNCIAQALDLPLSKLIEDFEPQTTSSQQHNPAEPQQNSADSDRIAEKVQKDALQMLESWLIQWPTIAKRVQANPNLSATKLLPFIRPVEQLMADWDVEPIAQVDEKIPYDPQWHQLVGSVAEPGDLVQVTHTGQTYRGRLLHRAKVKRPQG